MSTINCLEEMRSIDFQKYFIQGNQ